MKSLFTCVLLLFCLNLAAQPTVNLVLNPGFEQKLPNGSSVVCSYMPHFETFNRSLIGWKSFPHLTPDIINWKPDAYGDCFFPKPRTGDRAIGLITYLPKTDTGRNDDFHEFIHGKLKFPLVPGLKYDIEFYIMQADSIARHHLRNLYGEKQVVLTTATGNFGIYFSYEEQQYMELGEVQPQFIIKEPIVTQYGEWLRISGTFVPDRPYLFFTMGNFSFDKETPTSLPNGAEIEAFNLKQGQFSTRKKRVAYYCLDDISISPAAENPANSTLANDLKKKKAYTFKNVNFETGKWDLLPESLPELDALAAFLTENPKVKALIAGHTDDVGKEEDNLLLSENRAEATCNYLIAKGIAKDRLNFKGYGEQHSVKPNDTPEGRRENRRVECRIQG